MRKQLILLAPPIIFVFTFFIIPSGFLVLASFTRRIELFWGTPSFSLHNYTRMLTEYLPTIWNTIFISACAAFLNLLLYYPLSYFSAREKGALKGTLRSVVRASMVFPFFGGIYVAYGLWLTLMPGSPIVSAVELIGIPLRILYTRPAIIIGISLWSSPFMVLYVSTAIQEIDPSLEEAARCLGAGPLRAFLSVTLPLSLPGILAGLLCSFAAGVAEFLIPMLVGNPFSATERMIGIEMYTLAASFIHDIGMASAFGVFIIILAVATTYISMKIGGIAKL